MEVNGHSLKYYLIGHPVAHSLSPIIYNSYFKEHGIPASYGIIDVASHKQLVDTLKDLRRRALGFNITKPHKISVTKLLDFLDKHARIIGAVNTVKKENNRLIGYNTDWIGFREALQRFTGSKKYNKALLLGAGGAGRAVAYALVGMVDELIIVSKSGITAEQLAVKAIKWGIPSAIGLKANWNNMADLVRNTELIVNATPVGFNDSLSTPIPPKLITSKAVVFDLVYRPLKTRLLKEAESKGCNVIDGLWMLVYQASMNIKIWFGFNADAIELRRYALKALEG